MKITIYSEQENFAVISILERYRGLSNNFTLTDFIKRTVTKRSKTENCASFSMGMIITKGSIEGKVGRCSG